MKNIKQFENFNEEANNELENTVAVNEAEWLNAIMNLLNDKTMVYVAGEAIEKGMMLKAMIGTLLGVGGLAASAVAPAITSWLKSKTSKFTEVAKKVADAEEEEEIKA